MISGIITTVIISILLGTISPISSLGVNFSSQNLFSQIVSKLPKKSLSEVNPMESLSNVTAPLDNVFRAIKDQLGGSDSIKNFLGGGSTTDSYDCVKGYLGPSKLVETLAGVNISRITYIIGRSIIRVKLANSYIP